MKQDEVKMTHSGFVRKDGKRVVLVRFERGSDVAEGRIPPCTIEKNEGFSQEEVEGLEHYMEAQSDAMDALADALAASVNA